MMMMMRSKALFAVWCLVGTQAAFVSHENHFKANRIWKETTRLHVVPPPSEVTMLTPDDIEKMKPLIDSTSWSSGNGLSVADLPDNFYAISFGLLGFLGQWCRRTNRARMEERSWDMRLMKARTDAVTANPTMTERELQRQQAYLEPSAYGPDPFEDFPPSYRLAIENTYPSNDNDVSSPVRPRKYTCSAYEIKALKAFGVQYDPYYDDPYTKEELPPNPVRIDKLFGDYIYTDKETGVMEVFYKDKQSGLYYRQGARPRIEATREQQKSAQNNEGKKKKKKKKKRASVPRPSSK